MWRHLKHTDIDEVFHFVGVGSHGAQKFWAVFAEAGRRPLWAGRAG